MNVSYNACKYNTACGLQPNATSGWRTDRKQKLHHLDVANYLMHVCRICAWKQALPSLTSGVARGSHADSRQCKPVHCTRFYNDFWRGMTLVGVRASSTSRQTCEKLREHGKLHHSVDARSYTTMFNFVDTDAKAQACSNWHSLTMTILFPRCLIQWLSWHCNLSEVGTFSYPLGLFGSRLRGLRQ